ncbi:D-alanyl-D-alanine carboxypeptidase/D-alanyl-D-alanine endopeptidase [Haliangium sp.]|uniref:D-alanyl-D-alanine carboxypeptidase/D-alanyl-D-alanine endopeptidase n=1 Tax=Haliangium sp. TaxID=2663208 RepID=UPI003D0C57FE
MGTWKRAWLPAAIAASAIIGVQAARSQPEPEPGPDPIAARSPTGGNIRGPARALLRARIDALVAAADELTDARVGIFVHDLGSDEVLYRRDAEAAYSVASVTKLVTMSAALAELGPDYRYQTLLLAESVDPAGVVTGDLYLDSRGDPTLSLASLEDLARELQRAGVKAVRGDLVIDGGYFDDRPLPPHFDEQPEEQASFRAPVGAANLDRNAFTVFVRPGRARGEPAEVWIEPESAYLRLDRAAVVTQGSGRPRLQVDTRLDPDPGPDGGSHRRMLVEVTGQVRADGRLWRIRRRVEDPLRHVGEALRAVLRARGIRIRHDVRVGPVPPTASVIAAVTSEPLEALIRALGKDSDNFMAEVLLKTMAAEAAPLPGDAAAGVEPAPARWEQGVTVVERFLRERIGLDQGSFRYGNGSGLFDASAFSPAQIGAVLARLYRDERHGPTLMAALAIAGTDGTLHRRMNEPPTLGRVRAKTGTLARASALAGYVLGHARPPLVFAVFVNDEAGRWRTRRAARALQDGVAEALTQYLDTTTSTAPP